MYYCKMRLSTCIIVKYVFPHALGPTSIMAPRSIRKIGRKKICHKADSSKTPSDFFGPLRQRYVGSMV